jgi:hypothetical protein
MCDVEIENFTPRRMLWLLVLGNRTRSHQQQLQILCATIRQKGYVQLNIEAHSRNH